MKKLFNLVVCAMVAFVCIAPVSAASKDDVLTAIKGAGLPTEYVEVAEDYLANNEISEEAADIIVANIDKAKELVGDTAFADLDSLPGNVKSQLVSLVTEAASAAGLKASFTGGTFTIANANGKVLLTVNADGSLNTSASSPIKNTGLESNISYAVVGGAALVALVAVAAYQTKKVRA